MSCDHVREDLGGYVFDALDPAERDAVTAHLATCPACAAELARFSGLPALLARAEGLEIPAAPQAVEERLLDQIARERGAGRRPRLPRLPRWLPGWARGRGLVAGALAGAVLGAAVTAVVLRDDDAATPARSYELVLSGTGGAVGARRAVARHAAAPRSTCGSRGCRPVATTVYEVRCERPGWSASAGTFRTDARGRAVVVLTTAARLGEYESIRVVRRSDTTDVLSGNIN